MPSSCVYADTTNQADTGSEDGNDSNNQNITMVSSSFITDEIGRASGRERVYVLV